MVIYVLTEKVRSSNSSRILNIRGSLLRYPEKISVAFCTEKETVLNQIRHAEATPCEPVEDDCNDYTLSGRSAYGKRCQ